MAKTTAPLLSFGASGQIAKTQVYASWRGVPYARRHVVPANPRSASQSATRGVFSWISSFWKVLSPEVQAVWTLYAKGKPLTDRNAIIKANLANLRGTDGSPVSTLDALELSPGVNGGLAFPSMTLTDAGSHTIGCAMVAPTLPSGWTIVKAIAVGVKQQDAGTDKFYASVEATDAVSPYAPQVNMGAAATYVCSAFFEYTKPDGSTAYSPSITAEIVIA